MNNTPRPGQPEPPKPAPPPFDEPKPMRDPEPDRLPDEAPTPNPDESDAPPMHAAPRDQRPNKETTNLAEPEPLPPKKARQGREGRPVLYILIGALLLAMLVWWGVEIYGGAIAPEDPAGNPGSVPIEELQSEPAQ